MSPALLLLAAAVSGSPDSDGPPAAVPPLYRVDHRLEPDAAELYTRVFRSPPGSLRLNAATQDGYRCLPVHGVKAGTRYRLTFWYLTAIGSEGTLVARINQYDGGDRLEWSLPAVGRWKRATVDFTTRHDTTSAAVVFEIESPVNVFEAFLDDISCHPVGTPILVGP